mgnify:CR=1 FL=1
MEKYLDPSLSPQVRAEDIADRLTVSEMAEQLRYDAPPIKSLGIPAYNIYFEEINFINIFIC